MTEENPPRWADQAGLALSAASTHMRAANKILTTRPEAERGTAAEEAALLIAQAQAEAMVSVAGFLSDTESGVTWLAASVHRLVDGGGVLDAQTLRRGIEGLETLAHAVHCLAGGEAVRTAEILRGGTGAPPIGVAALAEAIVGLSDKLDGR